MAQPLVPVRMGMIGGGDGAFIGKVHRLAAALDGHIELVSGSFSRTDDNNRRTGALCGLSPERVHTDWRALLEAERHLPEDQRMQMVAIVTPNHLHVPMAVAALEAGFHVMSEKPAGLSLEQTQALPQALADSGRLYGLSHTYLGYPMVWQARDMVARNELGALRKIHVEYPQGWLADQPEAQGNKQAAWRTDPAFSGASGCMADIGTHAFGLAEFVSGHRIDALCASLGIHAEGRQLDDDGDVLFKTAEGASGTLTVSQVCTGEENGLRLRVYGEAGSLEWRQMAPNSLIHRRAQAPMQIFRGGIDQPGLCDEAKRRFRLPGGHPEGYLEALANLYSDFVHAIRAQKTHDAEGVPTLSSGLRGMAFIEAVTASQRSSEKWTSVTDTDAYLEAQRRQATQGE
ncbi:Gfo/Idh/MocA family protein [Larsenimonas salina]|uniref:Gfo/Idh/MocA family protein n=1 Tax=Larsenimonas salina TaxID=1295565 RepID=UPI0020745EA1|nr:Gfo/Idh/MocA family oxidoreductase [Larsenimonas salina]MCM5705651.1 Gfo/Idh/MocA family oxidoreductase [Larsenimonas salina]